jgi:ATP-dependent Clp protease ATP-binding subunit ClpC
MTQQKAFYFDHTVREAMKRAREESVCLRHDRVDTEDLLLGMLRDQTNGACQVLAAHNIEPKAIRETIERTVKFGEQLQMSAPDLPFTSRAKRVLALSMEAARYFAQDWVGTEHMLLAVVADSDTKAATALSALGLDLDTGFRAIAALTNSEVAEPWRPTWRSFGAASSYVARLKARLWSGQYER